MSSSVSSSAGAAGRYPRGRRGVGLSAIAVLVAGGLYVNTLDNPFIYDDHRLIVENRSLRDLTDWRAIFWFDATRPLVNLSYAVDRALWGREPFGFHLTSVLLHMLNVALVAALARRVAGDVAARWRRAAPAPDPAVIAPVAAGLFAAHPILTEAVGYISARSELLCATWLLVALLAARRWLIGRRAGWLVAAVAAWLLALASRETAVVFPIVLLAYDGWILASPDAGAGHRVARTHGLWLVAAAALVAGRLVVFTRVEHGGLVSIDWPLVWVALDTVRRYLALIAVPAGQAIYHAVDPIGPTDVRAWIAAGVVAATAAASVGFRRRQPAVAFGGLWFLLLVAPSTMLVLLDRGEPVAEHRVYLASAGVWLAAAAVADRAFAWLAAGRRFTRAALVAAIAALVLALGGRTLVRNAVWQSPLGVWLEAGERAPDHWLPMQLVGEELHRLGRHDRAVEAFERVIARRPQEAAAYGKLGVCLSELNRLDEAAAAFTRLRGLDPRSPEASNGLATVALLRGQVDAARQGYLETLALDAMNVAARRGLAVVAGLPGGDPAEALRWCREIARIAPETPGNDECLRRYADGGAGRGR